MVLSSAPIVDTLSLPLRRAIGSTSVASVESAYQRAVQLSLDVGKESPCHIGKYLLSLLVHCSDGVSSAPADDCARHSSLVKAQADSESMTIMRPDWSHHGYRHIYILQVSAFANRQTLKTTRHRSCPAAFNASWYSIISRLFILSTPMTSRTHAFANCDHL